MDRRNFIKTTSVVAGAYAIAEPSVIANLSSPGDESWFNRPMRWAQLTLVENDPGRFDPDFWLSYFKKIHADGTTLSAGGVVAYYPTDVPLHHRSDWLGNSDPFGYLVNGCRKMNMSIIARTDPHAARQNVYDEHPDWIAVTANGEKRRHWANKDLWVTCALGPYNFEFMTLVHKEIMVRYQPDGIFSNRWAGHGICYCEHCMKNFKEYSGLELPKSSNRFDKTYQKYSEWSTNRLKELWVLWDGVIRKGKSSSRFIPNGFPDKVITGQLSDIVFTDHQARSGATLPWSNGKGAKELRASIGMKPLGGIFSVGVEEQYRWKDSVQTEAEIRIWVAEGTANGMRPWFTKFSGVLYDRRWLNIVDKIYQVHYRNESYLRNTAPMARVGMVFSEQNRNYGGEAWQQRSGDHALGMYHALIEDRMPFEMVNDRLLDMEHLKPFKLLVLPNIAALSTEQCDQLRKFVEDGGSLVATFETSLYDEAGRRRTDFGLADLFGVSYDKNVEGPMQNSYLRLKKDTATNQFHPVLKDLEDAYRIINTINRVKVIPRSSFPGPVTLIPTYPDLPMEDVYPRVPETDIRELYLRDTGKGRIAYFPGDIDRTFWQIMSADHGKLLRNTIRWALKEEPIVEVKGPGVVDVTIWRQASSMTVHLVNLTNPMMMKGPFRELIPVAAQVSIKIPQGSIANGVSLLVSGQKPDFKNNEGKITLTVPQIYD
ncbi:MAG: beta-galactosidase trimerization domain-containing protein, partial [Planctomycetes bacterium]|nr:beta-galactosidase trimerization domain-containing protein [Planctomycetota bacterium]